MSEMIPGYDVWKTSPPEDPEPKERCTSCGAPLYEGDFIYTIDGGRLCEDCMRDYYGDLL